jgi:hypothetical protein
MDETRTTPSTSQRTAETPIEGRRKRAGRNAVTVDLEAYMPLLEDADTPDDQKMELLRALYAIMASFVDLGFALETAPCGQSQKEPNAAAKALRDHVYSSHIQFNERFENAAEGHADVAGEGVKA